MASEYVLATVESGIRAMYPDTTTHNVARLENNQDPEDIIKSNQTDLNRIHILIRDQVATLDPSRMGRGAPENEAGTFVIDVLVESGNEAKADAARALMKAIRPAMRDGFGVDELIEIEEIIQGPAGPRMKNGKFWGLMMSVAYFVAGQSA